MNDLTSFDPPAPSDRGPLVRAIYGEHDAAILSVVDLLQPFGCKAMGDQFSTLTIADLVGVPHADVLQIVRKMGRRYPEHARVWAEPITVHRVNRAGARYHGPAFVLSVEGLCELLSCRESPDSVHAKLSLTFRFACGGAVLNLMGARGVVRGKYRMQKPRGAGRMWPWE